jgi:hypothetical protein
MKQPDYLFNLICSLLKKAKSKQFQLKALTNIAWTFSLIKKNLTSQTFVVENI